MEAELDMFPWEMRFILEEEVKLELAAESVSETSVALLSRLSLELLEPFSPCFWRRSKVKVESSIEDGAPLEAAAAMRARRLATFLVRCGNEETGSATLARVAV